MSVMVNDRNYRDRSHAASDWPAVSEAAVFALDLRGEPFGPSCSWVEQRDAMLVYLRDEYEGIGESVAAYLQRNSDVAWELIGAKAALEAEFGASVVAVLDLVTDVDSQETRQQLFAYVRTALSVPDALEALSRFDTDWFIERLDNLGGRLSFDVIFSD